MDTYVYTLLDSWLNQVSTFATEISHTDTEYQISHWTELLHRYQGFKKEVLSATVNRGADMESVEVALFIGSLSRRYVEQMLQVKEGFEQLQHTRDIPQPAPQEAENQAPSEGAEKGEAAAATTEAEEPEPEAGADRTPPEEANLADAVADTAQAEDDKPS
jgi:hypothetical protein